MERLTMQIKRKDGEVLSTHMNKGVQIHDCIVKLAHYEDLEEMVEESCKKCKVDGYYAEWGNCDECGFTLFKTK